MEIRILGPLEVSVDGREVVLARPKQRALLACLLLSANEVVATDDLVAALWGERPPDTAKKALHGHVSALRKLLGAEAIVTRPPGYLLAVGPGESDLARFEALLSAARGAHDPAVRAQALHKALALFRGEPLADFRYEEFAGDEARRLDEVRLAALEDRIDADFELGRHDDLVSELERLVAAHPLHERLREQLMLALYRAGRQADALDAYQQGRRHLVDQLGLEPGPSLRELEQRILDQDPALAPKPSPDEGAPAGPREERKRVTLLLCDLVDVGADGPPLDPEDAGQRQQRYAEPVRAELENRGGTVQRAAGQTVMAVFGAPVAHEDDPERAVRGALAVRDAVAELGGDASEFTVRMAVHTGEALVALGGHEHQPAVVGEVVNAVSRLLQAALPGDILVGDSTRRATRDTIGYRDARREPVAVLGAWDADAATAPVGAERSMVAPLVGRDRELDLIVDVLARARAERRPQRVTVVGVPGIGKSRLVHEVSRRVDDGRHVWRQGRSLPYGDGVTFWALGEIVKSQAGIVESDSEASAEEKLGRAVAEVLPDPGEARWVESELRPLVGLAGGGSLGEQAFTAWRLFLEGIAELSPLTLALEDVQWADDGLLDFVDELVNRAAGVPLVVLTTARPELLERRPSWTSESRDMTTLSLSPLSPEDMTGLVSALLPDEAEVVSEVVERAGGNPLYAREYARLLADAGPAGIVDTPPTLHGLIAARLDALPPAEKQLAQDAAVIGEVAWLEAIAAVSGQSLDEIDPVLRALERKEFVRRVRRSTVEGQTEYAFHHVLIRDVAYGAIPRAARSEKHGVAADWIESLGRPQDYAEMLAHHSLRALELAQVAGLPTEAPAERARFALREAGHRARSLGAFAAADSFYTFALELWPAGDPDGPRLALAAARSGCDAGSPGAIERIVAARDELLSAGDREGAAEAEVELEENLWDRGDRDAALVHAHRAVELVEGRPASAAQVGALSQLASRLGLDGDPAGMAYGERALALARELRMPGLEARALQCSANARLASGDLEGALRDCDLSLQLEPDAPRAVGVIGNIAVHHLTVGDLPRSMQYVERALDLGRRVGNARNMQWLAAERALRSYLIGAWPGARAELEAFIAELPTSPHFMETLCRSVRALLRLADAEVAAALEDSAVALDQAREVGDRVVVNPTAAVRARCLHEAEACDEAAKLVDEVVGSLESVRYVGEAWMLPHLALVAADRAPGAIEVMSRHAAQTRWAQPAILLARGEHEDAADLLGVMGARADEAFARLLAAERLAADGLADRAESQRAQAEAFYRAAEAPGYLARAMSLVRAEAGSS